MLSSWTGSSREGTTIPPGTFQRRQSQSPVDKRTGRPGKALNLLNLLADGPDESQATHPSATETKKPRPRMRGEAKSFYIDYVEWAREELNLRPHAYQACALTT